MKTVQAFVTTEGELAASLEKAPFLAYRLQRHLEHGNLDVCMLLTVMVLGDWTGIPEAVRVPWEMTADAWKPLAALTGAALISSES